MRKRLTKLFYDSKEINTPYMSYGECLTEFKLFENRDEPTYESEDRVTITNLYFIDFYYMNEKGFKIDCWTNHFFQEIDII